jgi:hypothetical protein
VKWNLGFPLYLIADGEYPELSAGQEIECAALEFHPQTLHVSPHGLKEAKHSSGCDYRVTAEILYISDKACLIDFGLRAVCSLPGRDVPKTTRTGDHVQGLIYIGIPLAIPQIREQFMPSLKHRWRIENISANITPLIESVSLSGRRFRHYDESRTSYENVDSTNTGLLDYGLHCELIAPPVLSTRAD